MAIATLNTANAQKETKYAKLYYKDIKIETNEVTITVDNAVSTEGETKFKLKITNKTSDFLILKPEECKFMIDGKEMKPAEKWKIIEPNGDNFVIINIKGSYNSVKSYSFLLDGLYKLSADAKGIPTPDFRLPVTKNDFKTGNYSVAVGKVYKESDATNLKLNVVYNGDKMGILYPLKAGVVMPDGNEYASVKSTGLLASSAPIVMMKKGQKEDFTLNWNRMEGGKAMDMQKVEMIVKFNDLFTEVTPEKLKAETLNFEFDQATSDAKGK
ncbi:MAG: hypothetical protein JWO09_92 [Bacteroidetes bacterium]|nr:hypothetical protein [Bacteroidota bacterium]